MIIIDLGGILLFLLACVLAWLLFIGVLSLIIAPFYWGYRLIRYLIGVVFRVARGLHRLGKFVFRVTSKLGRFMCEQHHRRTGAPSNVVAFNRYPMTQAWRR